MSDEWVSNLSSKVFTRIKNEFSEKLKTKYKMTASNFSTVGSSNTPAVFPFVFVEKLESPEIGNDLDGVDTIGLRYAVRIHVSDNKSQNSAETVIYEIRRIMKSMRFSCGTPIPQNTTNGVRSYVLQCTRVVCGDEL